MADVKQNKAHAKTRKREEEKENGLSSPLNDGLKNPCPVKPLHDVRYVSTEIGRLPSSWVVCRFDSIFSVQQGKQVSKSKRAGGNQCSFLRTKNVYWGRLNLSELDKMHFSDTETERLALKTGDLLVCEGGSIGRTAIWNGSIKDCFYQNHLLRARLIKKNVADPQFMLYWLWYAFEIGKVYFGRGNVTTIPNLASSKLCELPIPVPPLPEQRSIATILGQVQKAIEEQEKLLALTAELKRTLLHQLFTHGLRNEPQKQTDIGPIPKSWEVTTVGSVARIQSGGTPSRDNPEYWQNGTIPWVKTGEIDYCVIQDAEEKITAKGLKESATRLFPKGTLLMAMYGQGVTRGRVGLLGVDAATNQACASITPNDKKQISSVFLYYFFEYHYEALRKLGHGANQRNMNAALIRSFPLAFPKPDEQAELITAFKALDEKRVLHERKKTLLQDLFRTLLHELMTAKTRVHKLEITT
jgi:type I restriction enzyme S subunit